MLALAQRLPGRGVTEALQFVVDPLCPEFVLKAPPNRLVFESSLLRSINGDVDDIVVIRSADLRGGQGRL